MPKFTDLFEAFWKIFPARRGKKLGKWQTAKKFGELSDENQLLCVRAAGVYAEFFTAKRAPGEFVPEPRDPIRFIRNEWWRDWLNPQTKPCQFRSLAEKCDDEAQPGDTHCKKHRDFIDRLAATRKRLGA